MTSILWHSSTSYLVICFLHSRRFELRTSPRLIQPADVSLGQIQLASFFDLKEDGTLDVLLEYKDVDQSMAVDFIRCEDKGDTTFLKVQVFSSVCDQFCGSTKTKIGIRSFRYLFFF